MENLAYGLKQKGRELSNGVKLAAGVAVLGTGLSLGLYLPILGLNAGIEALSRQPEKTYEATLVGKTQSAGLNTKSVFYSGDFKVENGEKFRVSDGLSVLDGKYLMNRVMPGLTEGSKYKIKIRGSTILGAEKI